MNKIVHYTDGYGGKLNYKTYCGKDIHSHSETEDATIDPKKVNCKNCKLKKEWKEDLADNTDINTDTKRRIYIESDILHKDELKSAQREVSDLCKAKKERYVRRVFSDIIDSAWHDLDRTWEAVKIADEIYSDSSLMPLVGGSYTGAPVIFNSMCERAIKENIVNKEVYVLQPLNKINWYMIKLDLMENAFKNNKLFMLNDEYEIEQVDVAAIVNKNKKNYK